MPLYQAIVLALVQAFTEFLPISSSAHLTIIPWLLGWADPGLAFDVALHAGTLLAVLLYFIKDWVTLILCGIGLKYPASASGEEASQHKKLFWYLVVGTIPGGLLGFLFEKRIEEQFRTPIIIGVAMIALGLLMWWADSKTTLSRPIDDTNLGDAVTIGTAQALALCPGVSRSGITITTGLFRGFTREAATRFSFLLSTPLIAGAAVSHLPKLMKLHKAGAMDLPMSTLLISVLISAVGGYVVIAFFLKYLQTRTLKPFVVYRLLFGLLIIVLTLIKAGAH
jgi:undecaprenyl-diphosphatase